MVARHSHARGPLTAAFMAHSLGSGYLAALLRRAPELASSVAFFDPICFLLPDGTVLNNYLYKPVLLRPSTWYHWLQRYVVADEPTQQDCFRNCFWWSQFWLHPSELPCDAIIQLSGQDRVANTYKVFAHLRAWERWMKVARSCELGSARAQLDLRFHETWSHGWLCFHLNEMRSMIHALQRAQQASDARLAVYDTGDDDTVPLTPSLTDAMQTPLSAPKIRRVRFARSPARRDTRTSTESQESLVSSSSDELTYNRAHGVACSPRSTISRAWI